VNYLMNLKKLGKNKLHYFKVIDMASCEHSDNICDICNECYEYLLGVEYDELMQETAFIRMSIIETIWKILDTDNEKTLMFIWEMF
jgi:hypothetical protein